MNKLIWSELAYLTYEDISNFLLAEFSLDIALKFDEQVEKLCSNLSRFKEFCPQYKIRPELRICTVNQNVSLIYRIDNNKIHLITFHDNRSIHPN